MIGLAYWLNIAGLLVNVSAALIMIYFPPHTQQMDDKGNFISGWSHPAPAPAAWRYKFFRRLGMPMLLIGFILQLLATI